ncbi:MAG: hypothetical protein WC299_06245 [Kiritimatiellia bacterium]
MMKKGKTGKRREGCPLGERTFLEAMYELSRFASDHADEEKRRAMAIDLLEKAMKVFPAHIHGGSVESWNIAESKSKKFEEKMPVFACRAHGCVISFYLSVLLLRKAIDDREDRATDPKTTMWGHFLMGFSRLKVILQADIAGSIGLSDSVSAIPYDQDRKHHYRFLDVKICRHWLNRLRDRHENLLHGLHSATDTICHQMRPRDHKPIGNDMFLVFFLSDFMEAYRETTLDKLRDLALPLVKEVNESEPFARLVPIVGSLFGAQDQHHHTEAFVRQMLLQAVTCPSPESLVTVGFVPDISYEDSEQHSEISSTALQMFLPRRLHPSHSAWRAWAVMASMVGREKSVHDFSAKEKQEFRQDALHTLKGNLQDVVGLLQRNKLAGFDRLPVLDQERIEHVRARLRNIQNKVQFLLISDARQGGRFLAKENVEALRGDQIKRHFDEIVREYVEDNSHTPSYGKIPQIQDRLPKEMQYDVVPEGFQLIVDEIVDNLIKHGELGPDDAVSLSLEEIDAEPCMVCLNTARKFDFERMRHELRAIKDGISGLQCIRSYQRRLGCRPWSHTIIDELQRRVRFVYPFGRRKS